MANNFLGEVRRAQVLGYGPGAIIDFRAGAQGGGPVSVIAAGLDHWEISAKPPFPMNSQTISEPRLERKLGVNGFRLPPVDDRDSDDDPKRSYLIGARFPYFLQCPSCNEIKRANRWDKEPGDPSRWCSRCSTENNRVHVVPTRFVTACVNGHIDEFPWEWWLERAPHKKSCRSRRRFKLENRGSIGLTGLYLVCIGCGASVSMAGIFGADVLKGLGCRGRQPWLGGTNDECDAVPRVLQRGASNLYFPVEQSALSIPPWSDKLQNSLGVRWSEIAEAPPEHREILLKPLAPIIEQQLGIGLEEFLKEVNKRIEYINNPSSENLRQDEFKNLCQDSTDNDTDEEFEVRQQDIPLTLERHLANLGKVVRLREVRALTSFTRIFPPASDNDSGQARFGKLSNKPLKWLPAVEVRGEGVFLALNEKLLAEWERKRKVVSRIRPVSRQFADDWSRRHGGEVDLPYKITPRFVLIHSLAHALMRYMSLECGYDTASLRERLYVSQDDITMSGVLIYTSSSDAEGTLGGLARQAEPDSFNDILHGALESISWCSSDPLCISGTQSASENLNLAACHACLLVPETSCELHNRFLDRATLIGSLIDGTPGYFTELLKTDNV